MAKFLLVEDDKIAQVAQGQVIKSLGYDLDIVASAEEAMQKLLESQNQYDLIFMDIGLPDADGMMLSDEIRTMFNVNAPIIAVTTLMPEERWFVCKKVGIDDYIVKPATKDKLQAIIKKWLESKQK